MKKQFLIAYAFIFAVTSGVYAVPVVTSTPTMSRVYGNQYTPEVPVTQDAGDVGVLDNTFGTNGSMSINAILSGSTGQVLQTLPNGDVAVVVSKAAADSYLALYDAQGAYVSGFNSGAPQDLGAATLNALAMMVDNQGRYVIAGGAASGTAGWLLRVAAAGGAPQSFVAGSPWQYIGGVAQQTSGKIIAVGFNGTNAMIARYTAGSAAAAGALDTTFGTTGYTVLDGLGTNLPTVGSQGLVSVFVDSNDNIYVAFVATATAHSFTSGNAYIARFTAAGAFDTTWGTSGVLGLAALNSATSGLYLAQSANGNIIVGAQVGSNDIYVTGVTSSGGAIGGSFPFHARSIGGYSTDTFAINNLITDSSNHIYVVGSDVTTIQMAVIRVTSTGVLDTTFNTNGYNFFNISSPNTTSQIKSVAIAPDGQLYTTGYQVNATTTTPYLSRLYNNQYVSQVQQYPNATQEQGILDLTFGDSAIETYTGVTTPFNGLYGPSMMQRATAALESVHGSVIPTGDIVVGMNGFTNTTATQSMMLAFLTSDGDVDTSGGTSGTSIPTSGYLTLANASSSNEYVTSMLQDGNGNIYVSGYASTSTSPVAPGDITISQAFVRSYAAFTTGTAAHSSSVATTGYQGVGLGYQGFSDANENRILLCVATSTTAGRIYGYNAASGALDLTFGAAGSGYIASTSYGLNMGPCYGLVTATTGTEPFIFAAYVNNSGSAPYAVNIVKFQENGNGLIPEFGSSGVVANLFPSASVAANNVRIGLLSNNSLLVVATTTTQLLAVVVDPTSGATSSVLTQAITGATALNMSRVTGVSDGTAIVTMSGTTSTDDIMYLARLNSLGGTLAPALDTTFNSQGAQAGVQPIQIGNQVSDYNARVASYALVQSTAGANQGNIAVIGYESVTANDVTPMVMRSYGVLGTTEVVDYPVSVVEPGTFDFAKDLQAALGNGFGDVIFAYPSTNTNAGKLLVGIDNGTTTLVARVTIDEVAGHTVTLDTTFNSTGIYTVSPNLRGVSHISIDNNNNILVGGTDGGAGWAQVINNAGSSATAFDMTGLGIAGVNNILQQQSGRYIVAGKQTTSSAGIVVAFQDKLVGSATAFAVDPTFNPLSYGSAPYAGSFVLTNSDGLYAMAIQTANRSSSPTCQLDMINIAYNNAGVAYVAQITADGNGYVFGPTSTTMSVDNSASVQLNIDSNQNIVVACSYNSGATHQLTARRYDCAGGTSTAFYGAGVSGGIQTLPFTGSTSVTLTGVMETTLSQTVLTGYNVVAGSGTVANGPLFAARLVANGALDTVWNTSPVGSDYAGLLTYSSGLGQLNVNGACIANSGNVYSIGSSNAVVGSSDPIVSVVYGTTSVTQVSQNPLEVAAGIIDTTLPSAYTGAAGLGSVVTGIPQKIYEYNSSVNSSPNGAMLVASVAATRYAYITQLNADLTVNTANFGTSGVVTLDLGAGNVVTITDLYVGNGSTTSAQSIYVTGYTTAAGTNTTFAARITANGSSSTIAAPASSLSATTVPSSGGIRQSTNGRVLVSGYNGSAGVVVAYNAAMNAIDTSFGNNSNTSPYYGGGYYLTATDNPIVAMTTDNTDRLYIAYKVSASTINVDRVLENGTGLDTTWNTVGTVTLSGTALSQSQIKLAIDLVNNQLVVAAQDGAGASNLIKLARFNLSNGSAAGTTASGGVANIIQISGDTLQLADLFIDNNSYVGSNLPNIYVVGYVSASGGSDTGHAIVARVKSTSLSAMTLDTSYGTGGIANLAAGSMSVVTAGMLDLDRRVYLVGSNGSTTSYMARVFGDYYWQESSNTIAQATVGSVDNTLVPGYPGVAGADLSVASVTSSAWNTALHNGSSAYAVIENPNGDGSFYVAFSVPGGNLQVGKMNADLKPNPLFGLSSNGLTNAVPMATINSIAIDAAGNIIVAGVNSSAQSVVSYTSAGVLNATFATTVASNQGTTVAQQKSGRYIVGGYNGTTGLVTAFKNESAISSATLPVDATFGPAGNNGYFATGVNAPIDDLVIDSNDYIYIVYRNGGAVNVAKLTPEGSLSNISTFGAGTNTPSGQRWAANPITAGSSPAISITASQPARIAINSAGNILVGAAVSGGITTQLINASTGAMIGSALTQTLSNVPVLTKLVGAGATSGSAAGTEFYGTFYNSSTTAGGYVFAVDNTGILDTSFNGGAVLQLTGLSGINGPSLTAGINGLSVQFDGKLVAVGGNTAGSGSSAQPILMRAYGYEYVAQFAQAPDQIGAGQLDTTLWPTTGVFALSSLQIGGSVASAFNTAIAGYAVKRVYEYGNGVMLFVADSGNNTIIFQLKKDLSLDGSFNSGGTPGYVALSTNYGGTTGLFVDSLGNIFVTGNKAGAAWAQGFTSTGVALSTSFAVTGSAITSTQILQQSNGRVILSGAASSNGKLYGYMNSGAHAGQLDPSFGNAGVVSVATGVSITDIAIDAYDNIIAVGNNAGSVVLYKISSSGLTVTNLTSVGTAITGAVGNVKVVLDNNGNIVVAAATATGYALASYVNDNTTPVNTGTNIGSASFTVAGSPTPVLANIYATTDGKITLVGYNSATSGSTAYDAIAARLVSTGGSLTLDTTTFNVALTGAGTPQAGVVIASLGGAVGMNQVFDGIIHADDRIMLVGSNVSTPAPLMARVFGDVYATYISQAGVAQGVAGTLNTTFGDTHPPTGAYNVATLNSVLDNGQGKALLGLADGGFYMALDNADSGASSILIKTLADGSLDTSYNTIGIAGYDSDYPNYAPLGVRNILQDGSGNVVLVGTTGGAGWVQRYTSAGVLDTAFNGTGIINLAATTSANAVVEQTLARLVVAGSNSTGAVLYAYESLAPNGTPGSVDTTFNAGAGGTPGYLQISSTNPIYNLVADQYDRLIFAVLNSGAVDLYRLTPTGELDATFGTNGKVAGAISSAAGASSVRVALDAANNIIVAANSSTSNTFSVRAYDNGTNTTGGNGIAVYAQLNISSLIAPSVTSLICSADGYALICGNESLTNPAWIARIRADGALDTAGFNPNGLASGGINGIFQYSGSGTTAHVYNAIAMKADGTIGMFGYENSSGVYTPNLVSVYDDPYTTQEPISPDSKPVGSIDLTLGWNQYSNGIIYYGGGSAYTQTAKAVALYDDNNIVVAIDGANSTSTNSSVFLNMFDTDGLANPNFPTASAGGSATVLQGSASPVSPNFQNQYVSDMVTYTTLSGVHKAIVAGYTYNSALPSANQNSSMIFQYTLTPGSAALDTSFGGYNGSPAGIAFGDAKKAFVVGQQSTGRIIVGGLSQNNLGVLLGYTANGKLDMSFGNSGYQSSNTGSAGIYSHAIDTENRIAIVYNNWVSGTPINNVKVVRFLADGSAVDSSFAPITATLLTTGSLSNDMKVAVDSSNNVYVASVTLQSSVPNEISVAKYSASNGHIVGSAANLSYGSIGGLITANYVIGRLIIDAAGNTIIVAYDTVANKVLVIRLNTSLALDSTFNAYDAVTNPTGVVGGGYVLYGVNNGTASQVATDAMVHPDGRIIIVGSEN